jgi:hypothetical protein
MEGNMVYRCGECSQCGKVLHCGFVTEYTYHCIKYRQDVERGDGCTFGDDCGNVVANQGIEIAVGDQHAAHGCEYE